jgi:hypothetical protein
MAGFLILSDDVRGWAKNFEVQLTLFQPGGQIITTTILLAHPD